MDWQKLQDIYAEASEVDNPAERSALLGRLCADLDDGGALRREVEELLDVSMAECLFDRPPFVDLHTPDPLREVAGRRIGPYELVAEIGRGGLGVVYAAVRVEFGQRVALKVIKRGMDTDEVVARFNQERRILANLEHVSIARLFDGGSTDDGLPYFVMELVEGERLDAFCAVRGLSADARLQLFLEVCSAVAFAHRNLVVHRDLKPANVLVRDAADPQVKLLDFGIAKLLTPDAQDSQTLTNLAGSRPMTPDYASPEQIQGGAITTASDVFTLGIVLHELLTGELPDRSPEHGASVVRGLTGDLASIVRKATRQEPEQRYLSVAQLADDIRHFLTGRPVLAREGAALYRAGKFVRRHRWRLAAALIAMVVAAFGVAMKAAQDRELAAAELTRRLAAERAEEAHEQLEIRSELLSSIFTSADYQSREHLTLGELLSRGEARVRENLDGEPLATQLEMFGLLYGKLGASNESMRLLHDVLDQRREIYTGDHSLLARVLSNLGIRYYNVEDYTGAGALFQESLDMRRRMQQEDVDFYRLLNNLASVRMALADYEAAEGLYRESLEIRRTTHGEDSTSFATGLRSLGTLLCKQGKASEAVPLLRRALEIRKRHYGEVDTRVASAKSSLGRALHTLGEFEEAEAVLRSVLDVRRELLGEGHPHTEITRRDLNAVLGEGRR